MKNVVFQEVNVKDSEKNISIVPAVFINEELYCYGDFDDQKLLTKLNSSN